MASGMGGIRTAGDLVARMQMKGMRLKEAKKYVAERLKIDPIDLANEEVMREIREDLDIGIITGVPGCAKGMDAKVRIANLLEIEINCVEKMKTKTGLM
jgi:dimethylamine--corrinoid protein Co-methyltransferase